MNFPLRGIGIVNGEYVGFKDTAPDFPHISTHDTIPFPSGTVLYSGIIPITLESETGFVPLPVARIEVERTPYGGFSGELEITAYVHTTCEIVFDLGQGFEVKLSLVECLKYKYPEA